MAVARTDVDDRAARRVEAVLRKHRAQLLWVARRWSGSADDAEDALQRTMEIYVRRLDSIDPATEFAWLKVVIRHEAMAIKRAGIAGSSLGGERSGRPVAGARSRSGRARRARRAGGTFAGGTRADQARRAHGAAAEGGGLLLPRDRRAPGVDVHEGEPGDHRGPSPVLGRRREHRVRRGVRTLRADADGARARRRRIRRPGRSAAAPPALRWLSSDRPRAPRVAQAPARVPPAVRRGHRTGALAGRQAHRRPVPQALVPRCSAAPARARTWRPVSNWLRAAAAGARPSPRCSASASAAAREPTASPPARSRIRRGSCASLTSRRSSAATSGSSARTSAPRPRLSHRPRRSPMPSRDDLSRPSRPRHHSPPSRMRAHGTSPRNGPTRKRSSASSRRPVPPIPARPPRPRRRRPRVRLHPTEGGGSTTSSSAPPTSGGEFLP